MASDALWIVSFKCAVKGYQECRFDVNDGEVFKVSKKIAGKGRAFRIASGPGQLSHLACKCFDNLVSEDVCKRFNRPKNRSNRSKPGIY